MTIASCDMTEATEELEAPEASGCERPLWRFAARAAVRTAAWSLVAAFVALVVAVGIAPLALHATKKTIITGSMAGTYNPGDVVVIQPQGVKSYKVGDAVTFQPNSGEGSTYITHRIIGVSLGNGPGSIEGVSGFTTQGDANNVADKPIEAGQVVGKVLYHVPYIGYASQWVAGIPLAPLALALGVGLIAWSVLSFVPWARLFSRRRRSLRH